MRFSVFKCLVIFILGSYPPQILVLANAQKGTFSKFESEVSSFPICFVCLHFKDACCLVLTLRLELHAKRGLKAGIWSIHAFALPAGGQVPRFLVLPVGGQDPFVSLPLFLSRVSGGRRSWLMEALLISQTVRDRRSRKEDALVNGAWTSNLPNSPLLPSNNGRTTGLEDPSSIKADKSWPWRPVARSKISIINRSLFVWAQQKWDCLKLMPTNMSNMGTSDLQHS